MGQYAESSSESRWRERCEWFQHNIFAALLDGRLHRRFRSCNDLVRRINYLDAAYRRSKQLTNRVGTWRKAEAECARAGMSVTMAVVLYPSPFWCPLNTSPDTSELDLGRLTRKR